MYYLPEDNYSRWSRHDAEQEEQLERLPKCTVCGKPIQDEYCYEINDEIICEDCMKECFRKDVEDLIERRSHGTF